MSRAVTAFNFTRRWGRPLVRLGAGVFGVSTLFPLVAGIVPAGLLPSWVGIVDVGLAIILVILMLVLVGLAGSSIQSRVKQFAYEVYRGAASLLIVLLIAYFVFGNEINWNVLLIGLAWRAWVLFYSLPAALTVWEMSKFMGRRDPTPVKQ